MLPDALNERQRTAIAYRVCPERDDYAKSCDALTTPETKKTV